MTTSLDVLDPTRADDSRFDPHGAQALRVRDAALTRAGAATPLPSRRGLRRAAVAGGAAVALALAGVILATSGSPPDARAALGEAAERMADVQSGRVIVTRTGRGDASADHELNEVRFDGADLEWVTRGRLALPDGRTVSARETFREIDGVGYLRDETRPGAAFERLGRTSDLDFPHQLVRQVGKQSLVELARRADDLTTRSGPNGGTVYRATATARQVFDAAPAAAARAPGGAWTQTVTLEVTVGRDGWIRRVQVASRRDATITEFADLGEPQAIETPHP